MFFDPGCIPCIITQAYNAARTFTNGDKEIELKILKEICNEVNNINKDCTAPGFSSIIQNSLERNLGVNNLYEGIKKANLITARQYIPYLDTMIKSSIDPLEMAVRTAITGNTIDMGANPEFNIEYEVNRITSDNIILTDFARFKEDLATSSLILYIGDNFEEALFDMFLLKVLSSRRVVFAVRSRSILNDITLKDAEYLGIDKICEVIESGSTIAGTDLSICTTGFLDLYRKADIVIAKGQGNYETLMNEKRPIYFLFKIKCEVISKRCGYPAGKGILLYNQPNKLSKDRNDRQREAEIV
jgi:damage-control phosphatase, subfamily I